MGSPHMGIFKSPRPFPYRDHHMETVILLWKIFPYGDFYLNPHVGTLKDGYVCNVFFPRIPQIQSASHDTSHELITPSRCIQTGTPLPDYLRVSSWIPTLPKLGSHLGFSQRIL